jgi:prolyl oligopeptidase PreP (S9A serine peptidase family)
MLRFSQFTAGKNWIYEYGNPNDANDFAFIKA